MVDCGDNLAPMHTDADLPWHQRAACRGTSLDLWFNDEMQVARGRERAAKDVCLGCPVLGFCGTWVQTVESRALARRFGIFGGMTSIERWRHQDTVRGMTADEYAQWLRSLPRPRRSRARLP